MVRFLSRLVRGHRDFGFIEVVADLFTGITLFPFAGARLLGDDIADFAFAIALARVLLATRVKAKTVFVKRANGNAHHLFPIGEDDAFLADNIAEVFLDGFADFFFMAFLVNLSFAVQ